MSLLSRRLRWSRLTSTTNYAVRSYFIKTETTPNPESMKFLPDTTVLPAEYGTGMHFDINDKKAIRRSPLVKKIIETDGVKTVFLGKDFITITKKPTETWKVLKTLIFSAILDHFASGEPSVTDEPQISDTQILEDDSEVVALIKELIETKVRPSVQDDGGDIFFVKFDEQSGLVSVRLAGSCVGCPSSSVTLRNGVENMLKHYIPEVKGIMEAPPDEEDEAAHDTTQKLEFHPTAA